LTDLRVMNEIADGQLMSSDGLRMGRATDVGCERLDDGQLRVTTLVHGPEATLRRIASSLTGFGHRLFGGRHERQIGIDEVVEFGPTLRLRCSGREYGLADGDRWAARLLRWIPGSAYDRAPDGATATRGRRTATVAVWISDLIGKPIVDEDGNTFGHVVEIHVGPRHHRITELMPGTTGWLDRLGVRTLVHRLGWTTPRDAIRWAQVISVETDRIVVQSSARRQS
jgi:sporulation protein YlmC with PRC-barrel domain